MPTMPRARRRFELYRLALSGHRIGLLSWGLALGLVAYWFGTIYQETISGSGGAAGFAAVAQTTADAMRPLTGPAERLDTYGGYFTYHNLGYIVLFMSIYAAIQGAGAVRGDEERGVADLWLAAGRARWTLVRDRTLAFASLLAVIAAVSGLGIALSSVAAGQTDWTGGFLAMAEIALTALVAYAAALLVSQLVRTARAAATIVGFALVVLYLLNNLADTSPVLGWLRWLSPFAYTEQSRALIPGHGVNLPATLLLAVVAVALTAGAAAAYQARDAGSPLLGRTSEARPAAPPRVRLHRLGSRDLWIAGLREQRVALTGWFLLAGFLEYLYVALGENVVDAWGNNPMIREIFFRMAPGSLADQYISFTVVMTAGIAVAFVVVQAARWLGDLGHGRSEMQLASGVTRSRLVLEHATTLTAGLVVISAAGIAGLAVGAWVSGFTVSGAGAARTFSATLLLGLGAGGAALLVVAWLRSGIAVAFLTLFLAGSWLITLFGGIAHLPDWLIRLSIFDAFGDPYLGPLQTWSVVYLAALAVAGTAVAMTVTSRRSSIIA